MALEVGSLVLFAFVVGSDGGGVDIEKWCWCCWCRFY